ncbi:MAG: suppressor of fused domain protein [Deltaproteobacteria bacterium]|jgi:hypothetical protein
MIEAHLSKHLGRPRRVMTMKKGASSPSAIRSLTFAQFAPGGPRKPVVYATVGGCQHRMDDGRRIEAIAIFKAEPRGVQAVAVRELLASVVLTPEACGRALRFGDVVDAPKVFGPAGLRMTAVLVLPPMTFAKPFHRARVGEETVDLVWAVPVFAEEAAYARAHGTAAFVEQCAAQKVDLTDLKRRAADVTMTREQARTAAYTETVARLSAVGAAGRRSAGTGAGRRSAGTGPERPSVVKPRRVAATTPALELAKRPVRATHRV